MAPLSLFAALLLLGAPSSASSLAASSSADVTPLLLCTSSNGRQMTSSERVKNFLDCLREQGHDEQLLSELKRSFDSQGSVLTPPSSSCPPGGGGGESDEKGRFPYCSGMTDLQCRTLTLVLESLLNIPESYRSSSGSGGSLEKALRDPLAGSQESPEDQRIQGALMNVILGRFNDILDEYKRWRVDHGSRNKRSAPLPNDLEDGAQNGANKSTSAEAVESPKVVDEVKDTAGRSKVERGLRKRRQAPPGLPFKLPDNLTPEMQKVLEGYLAWREKNGYGKMTGRWG